LTTNGLYWTRAGLRDLVTGVNFLEAGIGLLLNGGPAWLSQAWATIAEEAIGVLCGLAGFAQAIAYFARGYNIICYAFLVEDDELQAMM